MAVMHASGRLQRGMSAGLIKSGGPWAIRPWRGRNDGRSLRRTRILVFLERGSRHRGVSVIIRWPVCISIAPSLCLPSLLGQRGGWEEPPPQALVCG